MPEHVLSCHASNGDRRDMTIELVSNLNQIEKEMIEYVLFLQKGGEYRKIDPLQKALSMLTKQEMQSWLRSIRTDIRGASLRNGHPAPYPPALAERLIKLFSLAGDTVLDPFGGAGTTAIAAITTGRNSISLDIEPTYIDIAQKNTRCASNSVMIRRAASTQASARMTASPSAAPSATVPATRSRWRSAR